MLLVRWVEWALLEQLICQETGSFSDDYRERGYGLSFLQTVSNTMNGTSLWGTTDALSLPLSRTGSQHHVPLSPMFPSPVPNPSPQSSVLTDLPDIGLLIPIFFFKPNKFMYNSILTATDV